jgi:hypothetical protein
VIRGRGRRRPQHCIGDKIKWSAAATAVRAWN